MSSDPNSSTFAAFALSTSQPTSIKAVATIIAATTKGKSSKVKLNKGAAIGMGVGIAIAVIILIIIGIVLFLYIRRSKAKKAAAFHSTDAPISYPPTDSNAPTYEKGIHSLTPPQTAAGTGAMPAATGMNAVGGKGMGETPGMANKNGAVRGPM